MIHGAFIPESRAFRTTFSAQATPTVCRHQGRRDGDFAKRMFIRLSTIRPLRPSHRQPRPTYRRRRERMARSFDADHEMSVRGEASPGSVDIGSVYGDAYRFFENGERTRNQRRGMDSDLPGPLGLHPHVRIPIGRSR